MVNRGDEIMKPTKAKDIDHDSWASVGIAFCVSMFISLLLLKVTNMMALSWWIVTAPIWIPVSAWCLGYAILGIAIGWLYFLFDDDWLYLWLLGCRDSDDADDTNT